MAATKRIPVSEQTWKELGKMKEAGQTYDDLLSSMLQQINRQKLLHKLKRAEEGKGKWIKVEDLD